MSFGFGVGDFVKAVEIATKLRKKFADAPGQFQDVADEVRGLSIAVQDVDVHISDRITDAQRDDIQSIARGCRRVLEDLSKIVDKYRELDPDHRGADGRVSKTTKVWKRLTWSPEDVSEIRARISSNVSLLNGFVGRLTREAAAEIRDTTAETRDNTVEIMDNIKKSRRHDEDEELQAARKWLSLIGYGSQQSDFISKREPGTGQWLLDSPEFLHWVNTPGTMLYCPGIPGAGKTILTSVVVDHISSKFGLDQDVGIGYVYFNYRRHAEQSSQQVLSSLLSQLVVNHATGSQALQTLHKNHGKLETRPSTKEIMEILQLVTDPKSCTRAFILIDAIDECQETGGCRTGILSELFNLCKTSNVNVFTTSRFIPEIQNAFSDQGSTVLEIRATEHDVQKYLDGQIEFLPAVVQRSQQLQKDIKTTISSSVNGMFLLAQIYVSSLDDKLTARSIKNALQIFREQSTNSGTTEHSKIEILSQAYDQAMERIRSQKRGLRDLAEKALIWIIYAKRPLTIRELQYALSIEEYEPEFDVENIPEPEDFISTCVGLVVVDKESEIVRLAHYTTQQYFETTPKKWFVNPELTIAKACIMFLRSTAFNKPHRVPPASVTRRWSQQMAQYVVNNWDQHIRRASDNLQQEDLLLGFLEWTSTTGSLAGRFYIFDASIHHVGRECGAKGLHLASYYGFDTAVKILLGRSHDPNMGDASERTPISYAVEGGHYSTTRLLTEHGANINTMSCGRGTNHYWPIHRAVIRKDEAIVKLLLEVGAKLEQEIDRSSFQIAKDAAFLAATQLEYLGLMQLLLDNGACVEARDESGNTPLGLIADCSWGSEVREDAARLLLDRGADVNALSENEAPIIHACKGFHHHDMVKLLLERGANTEATDKRGHTALALAADHGNEKLTRLLIEHGAEIEGSPFFTFTPLYLAVLSSHRVVLKLLLEAGADPTATNIYQIESPVEVAQGLRSYWKTEILAMLLS